MKISQTVDGKDIDSFPYTFIRQREGHPSEDTLNSSIESENEMNPFCETDRLLIEKTRTTTVVELLEHTKTMSLSCQNCS